MTLGRTLDDRPYSFHGRKIQGLYYRFDCAKRARQPRPHSLRNYAKGVPQPQPLEQSVRGPRGHRRFQHEHNYRHRHSAVGYRTPAEYAAACRHTDTPVACEINWIRIKPT